MSDSTLSPGPLLEISGAYWKSCALQAGVKLGIFTVIGQDQLTVREIVHKLGGDDRGVRLLLNALTAMILLIKSNDRYANSPISATFLSKHSSQYIGHIIMHHYNLMDSWHGLDQAVLTGMPHRSRVTEWDEKKRESFIMGMFNLNMVLAPDVTKEIDLSGRERLLDLGGGPGTWAIHFCLNNPELRATIYDLPTTRPYAEKIIDRFEMSDRVRFQEGDYLQNEIKGSYDVAWLSHILHNESPENCQVIIRKAIATLRPGALIMVHDFILNDDLAGPISPALFSLNMLVGTKAGRSYSEREIIDLLAQAGVKEIKRLQFHSLKESGIIAGTIK